MKDLKEQIQELRDTLSNIHYSWRLITAITWTEEEWAEERNRSKEIEREIKRLARLRIDELETEKRNLEETFLKFSKRLLYLFKGYRKVSNAQKRLIEIDREINDLSQFLK